jgi:hypothetical protein
VKEWLRAIKQKRSEILGLIAAHKNNSSSKSPEDWDVMARGAERKVLMIVSPAYPEDKWPEGVPYPNLIAWREHQNAKNVRLKAEKMRLQAETAKLLRANKTRLQAEDAQLKVDTAELQAENARLKESVAAHIATTRRLDAGPAAGKADRARNTAQDEKKAAVDRDEGGGKL